jgi:acyl-CoA hydrolase
MESYKLVLPEHMNHYGYLYGGNLLKWVDEIGWIAASRDYPGCNFVTVAMDKVEFRKSVREGTILRFEAARRGVGDTSVTYEVHVFSGDIKSGGANPVFSTNITFVSLDDEGAKRALPK